MNTELTAPQKAELALHDFVSGAGPRPADANTAEVEALQGLRSRVAGLNAQPPVMEARWDQVLARAGVGAAASRRSWLPRSHAARAAVAATFVVVSAVGLWAAVRGPLYGEVSFNAAKGGMYEADAVLRSPTAQAEVQQGAAELPQVATATPAEAMDFPKDGALASSGENTATDWGNTLIREGSLTLRHKDPAEVQRKILDLLLVYGGQVLDLSRAGVGENTTVRMQLAVPTDKYARFVAESSAQGEVILQSESAKEAIGEIIDNEATLAEAQDYLKRLEALREAQKDRKDLSLSEFQDLERQLRNSRRDVQRLQSARDHLRDRTAMARLNLTVQAKAEEPPVYVAPGPFEEAWRDGTRTLERLGVFLLKALLGLLPLWIVAAAVLVWLWRRRRPRAYRFDD